MHNFLTMNTRTRHSAELISINENFKSTPKKK